MSSQRTYGEYQEEGILRQQWITNPQVPCPIEISEMTIDEFEGDEWDRNTHPNSLPHSYTHAMMAELGLPEQQYHVNNIEKYNDDGETEIGFSGRAGNGVLFIEDVVRDKAATGPFISQICKAVYEAHFPLDTLRYVMVTKVSNEETKPFINSQLNLGTEPLTWESDTPEFQAVLGTRIGKIVAYFILGAFERGTKNIARITMWKIGRHANNIQVRFDIEALNWSPVDQSLVYICGKVAVDNRRSEK